MSSPGRIASIVIDNYNYGRYLADAVESALAQTYPDVEVVVVDDGSTDNSRDVLQSYAGRVTTILKDNAGQGSAFNVGFAQSGGDVVLFLDSDDMLLHSAVERIMPWFDDPAIVNVHWPVLKVDARGRSLGVLMPPGEIPDGDLFDRLCRDGPATIAWPPTSGHAWSRALLRQILPLPEDIYRTCADSPLFELAPFFGATKTVTEPLTLYRMHEQNASGGLTFDARMAMELRFAEHYTALAAARCESMGARIDIVHWRNQSWWHRLSDAAVEIQEFVPEGEHFALIDDDAWAMDRIGSRVAIPFPEVAGLYAGPPADDAAAVAELERIRRRGVRFLVVAWQSFWWLAHYPGLATHLERNSVARALSDRLRMFELATPE